MCMITSAIIGGILSTQGQLRQLEEQEAQANFYAAQSEENARLARREAEAIGVMGMQEQRQLHVKKLAQAGAARTGYASQGVVLGGGVVADYEADIADAYSVDMDNLQYDIASRQWQKRVEAVNQVDQGAMYRYQADSFRKSKKPTLIGGVFSTLGDTASAVNTWLSAGTKAFGG